MTNAVRHTGGDALPRLDRGRRSRRASIDVRDDGARPRPPTARPASGCAPCAERAAELGGTCAVESLDRRWHGWCAPAAPRLRSARMIRLILADDHPVFADGLRAVFDAEPDLRCWRWRPPDGRRLAAHRAPPGRRGPGHHDAGRRRPVGLRRNAGRGAAHPGADAHHVRRRRERARRAAGGRVRLHAQGRRDRTRSWRPSAPSPAARPCSAPASPAGCSSTSRTAARPRAVPAADRAGARGAAAARRRPRQRRRSPAAWGSAARPSATTSRTSSPSCTCPTGPARSSGPGTPASAVDHDRAADRRRRPGHDPVGAS